MILAFQIMLALIIAVFSMGAIADNEIENRKIWAAIDIAAILAMVVTLVF